MNFKQTASTHKRGFTLIELLVVVAIIGLLSSIVLLNMKNTRLQAYDVNIQSLMHQLRNEAEFIYAQNGESYSAICDENNNTLNNNDKIGTIEIRIKDNNNGQDVICIESTDGKNFAASSPLIARSEKYWCIESAGLSREIDNQITTAHCE
ncbi:MAG: type II secretion system protein [Candidatus Nealsonbacteria bacterium]